MTDRPVRRRKPQTVLEVIRREQLTPHMVRLYLGGPNFAAFEASECTDSYVKIFFVKPELGLEPPYDVAALREHLAPEDLPVTRTYTVREVNAAEQWLSIDFVVHGAEGLAGPWAERAQPGERVVLSGPGGAFNPDPTADWHLFLGDESSLPAIAASLESLPTEAVGHALIEVGGPEDELPLRHPEGLEVRWLHRGSAPAGTTTILADAAAALPWREGRVCAFAHGEREAVKALRDVLFSHRELQRSQVSISGYWAYGRTEDRFQAEKREPVGKIFTD